MATTRKKAPVPPPPSDEELSAQLRGALRERALSKADLAKLVPKRDLDRALVLARELAREGTLHRFAKGATVEIFYSEDPIARLDQLVPELLRRQGPLNAQQLKKAVKEAAPHHDGVVSDWLKAALARNVIFQHPGKAKTFVPDPPAPDLKLLLKKPLAELEKLLAPLAAKGISREQIASFLRAELGVAEPDPSTVVVPTTGSRVGGTSRDVFLAALRRFAADNPKGALLPVRELRARAGLAKQDFDTTALALSREGLLVLHHHDHAASLSEAEKNSLVRDTLGRHYVGVALRGSA
jgi:hypothetical protein